MRGIHRGGQAGKQPVDVGLEGGEERKDAHETEIQREEKVDPFLEVLKREKQ